MIIYSEVPTIISILIQIIIMSFSDLLITLLEKVIIAILIMVFILNNKVIVFQIFLIRIFMIIAKWKQKIETP